MTWPGPIFAIGFTVYANKEKLLSTLEFQTLSYILPVKSDFYNELALKENHPLLLTLDSGITNPYSIAVEKTKVTVLNVLIASSGPSYTSF